MFSRFVRNSARTSAKKAPRRRNLRLERLEDRAMLDAAAPALVLTTDAPLTTAYPENVAQELVGTFDDMQTGLVGDTQDELVDVVAAQDEGADPSDLTPGVYDASTRTVSISWTDNSDDETGFRVEYSKDGGQTWTFALATAKDVAYGTAYGVKPDAEYVFRVCALHCCSQSEWTYSEPLDTTAIKTAPSDLTFGEYDEASRSVTLNWSDNSNAETGYRVEYSTNGGKTWLLSQTSCYNVSSRTVWNVKPESTYDFRVCALFGCEQSDWTYSETLDTHDDPLEAPSDLIVGEYNATTKRAPMSWTDNSDDEIGFRVEYSTNGGKSWRLSENMDANATAREAWRVHPNMQYQFRVCALRGDYASAWTYSEILDTTQPLIAPTNLTLGVYDPTTETLPMSWTDNSEDETGFRVEYSKDGGETWLLSEKLDADVDSREAWAVHQGLSYSFRVCAVRGNSTSDWAYATLDKEKSEESKKDESDVEAVFAELVNDWAEVEL